MDTESAVATLSLQPRNPLLIVISGPSGVGKDSVLEMMKARGLPFHFVITATTRAPRPDEVDGVDYFFLSQDEFAKMIDEGELLEYAVVYQDYKGIPKSQVREALASGKNVIMRIDVQGAETVRELVEDALLIFLTPQNEEELINRLKKRNTETSESLKLRIATTRQEYKKIELFDYVVVNRDDRLDETVDTIEAIIQAEQHRVHQRVVNL
ncbi:MAG TPA: guanylate kinase [Chloroflexi bacterium]|nr:MAG: guanylate kinase [Chloroflexota bacterium]HDD55488.1 guanylate kinase [Chloroflexota bacterium]